MNTPTLTVNLQKLEHNVRIISNLCRKHHVELVGVTKGTLAMPEVARAMLRGGATWLGDSRLSNIKKLKSAGITAPCLMMRSPHLTAVKEMVQSADISLNSDLSIIHALSEEALLQKKTHGILLMVDLGDLREGLWPDEVLPAVKEILAMKGIRLMGLGANLTDLCGVLPTLDNNLQLVELAENIEKTYGMTLQYLSAGNSSSLSLLASGKLPQRINQFRVGECLLLGRETAAGEHWPDTWQDAITLTAEIIESRKKPSVPIGELGQDAFGQTPKFVDKGMMQRSILNIGRQDVVAEGLTPIDPRLDVLGATSDHLVLDTTKAPELKAGDFVTFSLNYGALLSAMTSPYVEKKVIHSPE